MPNNPLPINKNTKHATFKMLRARVGLQHFLLRHLHAALMSLGKFVRAPWTNMLTVAVIAIAIALPATLWILMNNVTQLVSQTTFNNRVSLFLKPSIDEPAATIIVQQLKQLTEITQIKLISKEEGLKEFAKNTGVTDLLQQLPNNPLPIVLELGLSPSLQTDQRTTLLAHLQQLPEVDNVQVDMQWLVRLQAILALFKQGLYVLGSILALAVLLIIGNTIRLLVQNEREDIKIIKLVGGTHHFIRRPFLYTGAFYGMVGAIIASVLTDVFFGMIRGKTATVSLLYHSTYELHYLNLKMIGIIIGIGTALGILGAFTAVTRELHRW